MSSGVVTNYNTQTTRRVEWIVGVDYGEDYDKVQQIVTDILAADKRILKDPAPFIALHALDASSVNVVARVWVNSADYWGVYFDTTRQFMPPLMKKALTSRSRNLRYIREIDNSTLYGKNERVSLQ